MMMTLSLLLLLAVQASRSAAMALAGSSNCTFHPGRDYSDPAVPGTEHGLNATSATACCALCLADARCAAAAFAKPSSTAGGGVGRCYLKVSAALPVEKGAGGPVGCATSRAAPPGPAPADDDIYDCRLRHLAMDFASSVVLASWSPARAAKAKRDMGNGLRIDQCGAAPPTQAPRDHNGPTTERAAPALRLFVSPDGDDSAAGTAEAPLRSISGAQARIRQSFPTVASRPSITVTLRAGDYFVPARRGAAFVAGSTFSSVDSGSSASAPIVYAAEVDRATGLAAQVVLHGGVLLSKQQLAWSQGVVPGSFQTVLPVGVEVDVMDQLFLQGAPLIRARLPNGRPWRPLDGFNLTAGFATPEIKKRSLPNIPKVAAPHQLLLPCHSFSHTNLKSPCAEQVAATCTGEVDVEPPAAHSGPLPKPPSEPTLGACSSPEPGISLLSGSGLGPPDFQMIGKLSNVSACEAACQRQPCCSGFTWHDGNQAQWSHDCYLVTNPLDIWCEPQLLAQIIQLIEQSVSGWIVREIHLLAAACCSVGRARRRRAQATSVVSATMARSGCRVRVRTRVRSVWTPLLNVHSPKRRW
jgi:hypothetical protein